mmetsp:Transcript_61271/g.159143  ORF Transcript_61271/g.159143 Transcript_61271/m.159143 type:complete len:248 (+) Transcript_61271:384-1127(+)
MSLDVPGCLHRRHVGDRRRSELHVRYSLSHGSLHARLLRQMPDGDLCTHSVPELDCRYALLLVHLHSEYGAEDPERVRQVPLGPPGVDAGDHDGETDGPHRRWRRWHRRRRWLRRRRRRCCGRIWRSAGGSGGAGRRRSVLQVWGVGPELLRMLLRRRQLAGALAHGLLDPHGLQPTELALHLHQRGLCLLGVSEADEAVAARLLVGRIDDHLRRRDRVIPLRKDPVQLQVADHRVQVPNVERRVLV